MAVVPKEFIDYMQGDQGIFFTENFINFCKFLNFMFHTDLDKQKKKEVLSDIDDRYFLTVSYAKSTSIESRVAPYKKCERYHFNCYYKPDSNDALKRLLFVGSCEFYPDNFIASQFNISTRNMRLVRNYWEMFQ